jgi:protein-disulfide isomerase
MTMRLPARSALAMICFAIALTVGSASTFAQSAQSAKPAPPSPGRAATALTPAAAAALQKRVESYLRNVYAWGNDIDVKAGPLIPALAGDLYQSTVMVSAKDGQGGSDSAIVFISKDGRYVFRGELDDMNVDPYAEIRSQLHIEGAASKGPANASVTVVEFGDFECPVCRQLEQVLRAVLPEYPQIRFVFKNFPLESVHPWAMTAAIAGNCALQQSPDIFWKLHDSIYDSQDLISPENAVDKLTDLATTAGANPADLKTCMADPKSTDAVRASLEDGKNVEVTSTPTVFVDGRKFVGPNPNLLQQFIDYDLQSHPSPQPVAK